MGRFPAPAGPGCSDVGWVFDSPRWCRDAPETARHPENIPPEFPRAIIYKKDKRGPETDFPTASGPLPNDRETGPGVIFFGLKIPPQ